MRKLGVLTTSILSLAIVGTAYADTGANSGLQNKDINGDGKISLLEALDFDADAHAAKLQKRALNESCATGNEEACAELPQAENTLQQIRAHRFDVKCAAVGEAACAEMKERRQERHDKKAAIKILIDDCNAGQADSCDALEAEKQAMRDAHAAKKQEHLAKLQEKITEAGLEGTEISEQLNKIGTAVQNGESIEVQIVIEHEETVEGFADDTLDNVTIEGVCSTLDPATCTVTKREQTSDEYGAHCEQGVPGACEREEIAKFTTELITAKHEAHAKCIAEGSSDCDAQLKAFDESQTELIVAKVQCTLMDNAAACSAIEKVQDVFLTGVAEEQVETVQEKIEIAQTSEDFVEKMCTQGTDYDCRMATHYVESKESLTEKCAENGGSDCASLKLVNYNFETMQDNYAFNTSCFDSGRDDCMSEIKQRQFLQRKTFANMASCYLRDDANACAKLENT